MLAIGPKLLWLWEPLFGLEAECISEPAEDRIPSDAFVICDHLQNGVQGADKKRFVGWNRKGLAGRSFCPKDDVASGLMGLSVFPAANQMVGEFTSVKVSRRLHATARTCST